MYLSAYVKRHLPDVVVDLIDYRIEYPNLANHADFDSFIRDVARADVPEAPDILAFSLVVSLITPLLQAYPVCAEGDVAEHHGNRRRLPRHQLHCPTSRSVRG
jgi:hypothetical protein